MRARVIYDFSAQAEGELSVAAGEEVTITDQSVGSGWWGARNDFGREGLIPSSFVEPLDIPEPNIPPPPPPQMMNYGDASAVQDWDDDWDSDESDHGSMVQPNATDRFLGPSTRKQSENTSCSSRTFGQVPGSGPTPIHTDSMRLVPLRKGFPRSFLRSGGDDFLLNNDPPTLPQTEAIIEFVNGIFVWRPLDTPIQCKISSFHKDSKMKGIKSFIAYQLNTSLTKAHVSRRYKHFDWLYCRLVAKYPCVRIPPLPEKAITGRYEDEFVDERRKLLQLWLDRMCKHPVVAQSHVFIHFLTCADVKRWKPGKREAETDRCQGGRFYFDVDSKDPPCALDYNLACAEAAEKFAIEMERDTKILCDTLCDYHRKLSGAHAKDYSELSTACFRLCRSLETDVHTKDRNVTLIRALTGAGEAYKAIRIYHAAACEPTVVLLDCLRDFSRLFNGFPSVMCLGKCACISSDEADRLAAEGKLSHTDATSIRTGSLVITRSVQAECNWIMEQLRAEYLTKFAEYLREQARFHRQIADQLDQAASLFQN